MIESALEAGFASAGVDVRPHRPAADAGRRLPDAGAAPRPRRRHQRLAQPVRRQRHQVLLGARREAARRLGEATSRRRSAGSRSWADSAELGRARRLDDAQRALHRVLQEHVQQRPDAARPEDRRRRRARRRLPRRARRLPRARRRGHLDRLPPRRLQHQRRLRRDRAAGARRRGRRRRRRLRHRPRRRRRPAPARRRAPAGSTTATSCSTCSPPTASPRACRCPASSAR